MRTPTPLREMGRGNGAAALELPQWLLAAIEQRNTMHSPVLAFSASAGGASAPVASAAQSTGTQRVVQPTHVVSLYVNNKPGVLNRVALVFSRRGWNIDSLAVSEAHDGQYSHCTIVAKGEGDKLSKIVAQLNKLVDVLHAEEHPTGAVISRELALIKVRCSPSQRAEVLDVARPYRAETADITETTLTIEVHGLPAQLDELHRVFSERFGVLEVVRTGAVAIARGERST